MALPSPTPASEAFAPVWRALADPTRRRILDVLRHAPLPAGKLAALFAMTRFGVRKHLRVLEEAGLVLVQERGRERWHHLNPVPVRAIYDRWIRAFEEPDSDRLLRIKDLAEARPQETDPMSTETASLAARTLLVEVPIEASPERVWQALVGETSAWWHRDFYTGPEPRGFHIEEQLGGRMYEDWGDGAGLIWAIVNGLRAPHFLQAVGDSSKSFGGPHRSVMTWTLEKGAENPGTTLLRLEHSVFGHVSKETEQSLESGWLLLVRDCLKPYAETGERPAAAGPAPAQAAR